MHRVASRQNAAQLSSEEKLKTLTYLLTEDETKHCAAIKCLAVLKSPLPNGDDYLFTGSRDGTLKRYSLADGGATYSATFESHLDWVNSAVLTGGNTLVSGSSDTTIKVWNCFSDGTCIKTLKQHSDYVTCLAASKEQSNIVASAGLGGEVFVWDIEAAIVPISQSSDTNQSNSSDTNHSKSSDTKQSKSSDANQSKSSDTNEPQGYVPISAKGHKESVYSLAMNETGNVLVSGGTEKVVRVWDPRSGSKTMKLKGHTDNIRALLLDSTGRYCLSGSSDSMIRLWDLGQQRCVHSYAVHTDSVWALASTPTFSHVYSGGRDQSLYCTDLATRETILLCTNENPILELALHDDDIWVGTTNSSLQKWPSEGNNPNKVFEKGPSFLAGNLSFSRARVSLEGSTPVPVYEEPSYTIQGNPGIVQHEILSNRIQVLTKDTTETVKLWQITNGSVIEDYGKVSFEKKKEELMEMVNFPAWFTVGSLQRLGNLSIHIETPQCFFADMYSADLDITGVPEDHKVILARETLKGLFSPYLTKRKEKIGKQKIEEQSNAEQETEKQSIIEQDTEKPSIETQTPHENGVVSSEKDKSNKTLIPSSTLEIASNAENESKVYPPFKFSAASIITGGSEGGLWRKNIKNLNGSEDEKDFPSWVLDCLLRNNLPSRDSTKCSFSCLPYDSSTVPLLLNSRLSAPCILNIQKIINHLATKIDKQFDSMALRMDSKAPRINSKDVKIEILCNDQVLDTKMSLATVWKFVWKKPEDLVINYRVTRVEVA